MRAQICLRVGMNDNFAIPLNGLTAGENVFSWQIGKEFFDSFENSEILDAHLDADVRVEKSGRYIWVDCDVRGEVVVECDRCLDDLDMPIDVEIRLSVKYGSEESAEENRPGEREVITVPDTDAELELSQVIYDYVCLALPMQRTHASGECNPDTMRYYVTSESFGNQEEDDGENPFAALKDIFG